VAHTNSFPAGIADRADSPVLLRLLSGEDGGQFVAVDSDRFTVGSRADVSFPHHRALGLPSKAAKIRREAEGWVIRPTSGQRMFVNTTPISGHASLRSGDVIRLSLDGPDFQFVIQHHHQRSLAAIARDYAPRMLVTTTVEAAVAANPALSSVAPQAEMPPAGAQVRGLLGSGRNWAAQNWAVRNRVAATALAATAIVVAVASAVWLLR